MEVLEGASSLKQEHFSPGLLGVGGGKECKGKARNVILWLAE